MALLILTSYKYVYIFIYTRLVGLFFVLLTSQQLVGVLEFLRLVQECCVGMFSHTVFGSVSSFTEIPEWFLQEPEYRVEMESEKERERQHLSMDPIEMYADAKYGTMVF